MLIRLGEKKEMTPIFALSQIAKLLTMDTTNKPNYSKTLVYQNGNRVIPDDHTQVRAILATGIVERVENFGPLLQKGPGVFHARDKSKFKRIADTNGFELYVEHVPQSFGFSLGSNAFTEQKNTNCVYYQRING